MTTPPRTTLGVRKKASQPAYHLQPFDLCRLDCPCTCPFDTPGD
nr:MAG TPA: hypothetical protein [Caudoviricetes sp.]